MVLAPFSVLQAQSNYSTPYIFTTLAGDAGYGSTDGAVSVAQFFRPTGMAKDSSGNIYVADNANNTIRKITSAGIVTTFAGSAGVSGSADGAGNAARFQEPSGVAVDSSGNVYVADTGNNTIRKITSAGVVTTLAGTAGITGTTDATGSTAKFSVPVSVGVDASGNIYVADAGNSTIRKITSAGVVTTLAGTAGSTGTTDGTGSVARFSFPDSVAVDGSGNIYVGDFGNSTIRKVTSAGVVTTFAGTAGSTGPTDGTGGAARFNGPADVTVDNAGNLYVADFYNSTVRKVTSAGIVTTLAGTAGITGLINATGSAARFVNPSNVSADSSGNVYVTDSGSNAIRKITAAGGVTTLTGSLDGGPGSTDGVGSAARFSSPSGIAVDGAGNAFVADSANSTIRKITQAGVVTTLAGSAGSTGSTNGTGSSARFTGPVALAADTSGNVYVTDTENHTIRKITTAGVVTTFAGSAGSTGSGDAAGGAARFDSPQGIALDASGALYVSDSGNNTIRKISAAGNVTTFAGLAGSVGSANGQGSTARFTDPRGIAVDRSGNVYVADFNNHTVRKITPGGFVTTLAGSASSPPGSIDGQGSAARFDNPIGLAVDYLGNIYVTEWGSGAIRKITPNGLVTTLGGWAFELGSRDGPSALARFDFPSGLAVDASGKLYVTDTGNSTIRKGTYAIARIGDFDGDGKSDVLWHNSISHLVASWTSSAGFTVFGTEDNGWSVISNGDFDGDGKADVLWHNTSTGIVASWTSASGYQVYGMEGSGWSIINTGDFDGDGKSDVLWHNTSTGIVASWTSTSGYQVYGLESSGWSVIDTGDFDADGKTDVLWHNANTGVVASWTSTSGYKAFGSETGGWVATNAGDFDGDGKADVVWGNTISGTVASWTSTDGYKVFGTEGGGWAGLDVCDYDGDGKADLLWHNTSTGTVASWTSISGYQVYGAESSGWVVFNGNH